MENGKSYKIIFIVVFYLLVTKVALLPSRTPGIYGKPFNQLLL